MISLKILRTGRIVVVRRKRNIWTDHGRLHLGAAGVRPVDQGLDLVAEADLTETVAGNNT